MPADQPSHVVTLRVERRHAPFLREVFETDRAGRLDDLAHRRDRLRDPDDTQARAETSKRIVAGIDRGEIVADPEVSALLVEVAEAGDKENEYERVLGEHEAFGHLLRQLARQR